MNHISDRCHRNLVSALKRSRSPIVTQSKRDEPPPILPAKRPSRRQCPTLSGPLRSTHWRPDSLHATSCHKAEKVPRNIGHWTTLKPCRYCRLYARSRPDARAGRSHFTRTYPPPMPAPSTYRRRRFPCLTNKPFSLQYPQNPLGRALRRRNPEQTYLHTFILPQGEKTCV